MHIYYLLSIRDKRELAHCQFSSYISKLQNTNPVDILIVHGYLKSDFYTVHMLLTSQDKWELLVNKKIHPFIISKLTSTNYLRMKRLIFDKYRKSYFNRYHGTISKPHVIDVKERVRTCEWPNIGSWNIFIIYKITEFPNSLAVWFSTDGTFIILAFFLCIFRSKSVNYFYS